MWAFISFILCGTFLVYVPCFVLGIRWDVLVLGCIVYYFYVPSNNKWMRDARIWRYFRDTHLNMSFSGNVAVLRDEEKPRCFGFHPHGAHCVGAVAIATHPDMRHIRIACTSVLFWLPIIKEFVGWGNAIPVIKDKMIRTLKDDKTPIAVYPGAFNELPGATFLRDNCGGKSTLIDEDKFVYDKRKGFIEVAKRAGVPLVPVWVEGEYGLYKVYHPCPPLQRLLYKVLRYPGPFYSSGFYGTWWPKRKKITVKVGPSIDTKELSVEQLHTEFYTELDKLKAINLH